MVMASTTLHEDYWENFTLQEEDIEFLYNHLLETETPLTNKELVETLVAERIQREKLALEQKRSSGAQVYLPKDRYNPEQYLVFPALSWKRGKVLSVRKGKNPDLTDLEVIQIRFEDGEEREFAANLQDHLLNRPPEFNDNSDMLNQRSVLEYYGDILAERLEDGLRSNSDFVRIAGRWFPRALLVDINIGHLNLAEAVLDMAGGGPLPTSALLEQIELSSNVNPKLLEFSMDLALQEDPRFDEVGAAGKVLWFLQRLEPNEVLEPPIFLRYSGIDYDRNALNDVMLALERELDDELSPLELPYQAPDEVSVRLIFPHWRSGTLPLSAHTRHLFPTAYEAPRIRFTLVDGDSGEKFPAWVVRTKRYIYGLREWYTRSGLLPGSVLRVRRGKQPGEVILFSDKRRPNREWIRTVLVGSDGGIVFAMLKQIVSSNIDERMVIAVPDVEAIDLVWESIQKERLPFEQIVVNILRELAKLNPQSHVHASELYAAVNVIRRCPPGPLLSLLATRPWFVHVGDLHFRYVEAERN